MEKTRRDLLKTITALAGSAIIPFAGQSKPGVSGIIVSNHSGRNLDTVPATIEALPRIAEKINKSKYSEISSMVKKWFRTNSLILKQGHKMH